MVVSGMEILLFSMTMDIYSHVLPGMQQDAMSKLNDALKLPKSTEGDQNG